MQKDNTFSLAQQMVEQLDIPGTQLDFEWDTLGWEHRKLDDDAAPLIFILSMRSADGENEYGYRFDLSKEEASAVEQFYRSDRSVADDNIKKLLIEKLKEKAHD